MSDITPVHPEYHKEGVRFQLFSDGKVMARTRDLPAREVLRLTNRDTGEAWVPGHKNFNSLCRESVREGDVDDLIAEQRRISKARGLKRAHGEELFEALDALVVIHEYCDETGYVDGEGFVDVEAAVDRARAALAKAKGEKQ